MSVTDAITEAYATQPAGGDVIETLQFDHVTFDAPARIATGSNLVEDAAVDTLPDPSGYSGPRTVLNNADGKLYVYLPLTSSGPSAWFVAANVAVTPPGISESGPQPMRVRIDNVAGLMLPYLRAAIQSTDPIAVTYRAYLVTDLTQPGEVIGDLELRDVDLTATAVDATLGFREIERQAFPLATYDQTYYPALQEQ